MKIQYLAVIQLSMFRLYIAFVGICRLSKCYSLIASGYCGGVDEALKENQGQYKNVFIFDLGVNP